MAMIAQAAAGSVCLAQQSDLKQRLFERVFGDTVKLDPAAVARVKALPPGERLLVDRNKDGKNDEVWYIDSSYRHEGKAKPLLVRVIDEDGDLDSFKGPDLDSDLYVGDWGADGTVDVVIDYQDNDHDQDVDEMAMYFWSPNDHYLGRDALRAWWASDDGDDNLLWYDVNLTYDQKECQWRCHFGGDETFVAFGLTENADHWAPLWENPFAFFDPDRDGYSEAVVRYSGLEDQIESVRYSVDVDNDAFGRRAHDYDFSVTTIAPGSRWTRDGKTPGSDIHLPPEAGATTTLREIPTGKFMRREKALQFAREAPWAKEVLTWDEMNANTDGNVQADPHERWEGVIAHGSKGFPQIGGPPCSANNKRNEVSMKPVSPMTFYYDPTDRRLHLKGATEGWIHVDFDLDGQVDAEYLYVDNNQDGIFDQRQIDLDGDGKPEFEWAMKGQGARESEVSFEALTVSYRMGLVQTLEDSLRFIDAARAALPDYAANPDPVEAYFLNRLEGWMPETGLGANMRKTPAGARFYVDLLRDRLLLAMKRKFGGHVTWVKLESAYAAGDYRAAAEMLTRDIAPGATASPLVFRTFKRRLPLRINNPVTRRRTDWPITIPVSSIKAIAEDFNPDNCAVVAPERWIDWREVPHQLDEIDPRVGPELSFLADIDAGTATTYFLYYSPDGKSARTFPLKTDSAEDWVPPNIGWESNRAAYRAYWGQFDFFGKKKDVLIYPTIGSKSYHNETEWGIDALLVGKASGIGGLTLYRGEQGYPVQNPVGKGDVKFEKHQLVKGPVRCVVEIDAANIVPSEPDLKLRMLCIIYAEHQETEIRVSATGTTGEILLAPGFMKLGREATFGNPAEGYFGSWGTQSPLIDEIGMAMIGLPSSFRRTIDLPEERRFVLETSDGRKLRFWIYGDWRRGREYPIAPTVGNWHKEIDAMAKLLVNDVTIGVEKPQKIQGK